MARIPSKPFNTHQVQAVSNNGTLAVSSCGLVIDSTPRTPYHLQASAAVKNMMSVTLGRTCQTKAATAKRLRTTTQQACFLGVGIFRLIFSDLLMFLDISDWASVISLCRDSFGAYVKHSGGGRFWSKAIRTHFLQGSDPFYYGDFWCEGISSYDDDPGRGCFEQALRSTASGLVTSPLKPDILRSAQAAGVSKDELRGLFMHLLELDRVVKQPLLCFQSDAEAYFCAIALPWEPKMAVTPLAVLDALGALPVLKTKDALDFWDNPDTFLGYCLNKYNDEEDPDTENEAELAAFKKLDAFLKKGDSGSRLMFNSGEGMCNPLPIFEVASFCSGRVVLGVMTTAVW